MFSFSDLFISYMDIGVSAWDGLFKIFGVFGKFKTLNWFLTGKPRVDFKGRHRTSKDGMMYFHKFLVQVLFTYKHYLFLS